MNETCSHMFTSYRMQKSAAIGCFKGAAQQCRSLLMPGSGWPWDCLTVVRTRCIPMEPWTGAVSAAIESYVWGSTGKYVLYNN